MTYNIRARVKKNWWPFSKESCIVFDVVEYSQVWYDPSYGNGGGDYRDTEKVVATYCTVEEATNVCDTLNKYKGGKNDY